MRHHLKIVLRQPSQGQPSLPIYRSDLPEGPFVDLTVNFQTLSFVDLLINYKDLVNQGYNKIFLNQSLMSLL